MGTKYTCANCGKPIEEGEFIAILGKAHPSGASAPIGRADKIIKDIGVTYCKECLTKVVESDPVSSNRV